MKKFWKIALICGGALLILTVLAGVGLWFFLPSVVDLRYANEERYSVGAAVLPDTIHTLRIHWATGEVKVETYNGKEIHIEEEGSEKEEDELRYLSRGGILDIRFCRSARVFGFDSLPEKDLVVRIPDAMAKELKEVEVESVAADVSLFGLEGSNCSIESVSGNVLVNSASFLSFSLETVSGKSEFDGFMEKAELETVSGNVSLHCPNPPERLEFSSISGDLNLAIQGDKRGFSVELETVSGNFSSHFPTETKNGRFVYGEGANRYEVETVSGNVKVEALDSAG